METPQPWRERHEWAAGRIPEQGTRLLSRPSVFEMAAVPGVVGGRLRGVIKTGRPLLPLRECTLSLTCVRTSQGRSRTFAFLWMDEVEVSPEQVAGDQGEGTAIAVDCEITYGVEQSRERELGLTDGISWHLGVLAHGARGRYEADFVVPVFYTPKSRPPEEGSLGGGDEPVARPASCAIRIESRPNRTVVHLPVSRAVVGWIVVPTLLAGLLALAAPWLRALELPWGWGVVLGVFVAAVAAGELVSRPRAIEVEPGWLTVRSGFPASKVRRRLPAAAISRVAFSVNHGIEVTSPGDVVTVARVRTRDQRWLTAELRRLIKQARGPAR